MPFPLPHRQDLFLLRARLLGDRRCIIAAESAGELDARAGHDRGPKGPSELIEVLMREREADTVLPALITLSRTESLFSPPVSELISRYLTAGTAMWISIRSIRGPLILER